MINLENDDKALVEWFLNEKWSSLAYLIQLSSRSASLQASRWYWRQNAEGLVDVGVDKIFWNQTRRALAWLKDWIQWDYTKNVELMNVKKLTVDDVLKLKFISNALKIKIESEAEDENVKKLWSDENYELKNKYTNNYALKKKIENGDLQQEDDPDGSETVKKTPEFTSDNITAEEMQSYVDTIKAQCENELIISDKESLGLSFEGKNLVFILWWTWMQKVDYVATTSYWQAISNTSEYLITEKIDVKTCLKWWDPKNGEYGNIDVEYVKNGVIREIKESIVNKKKAIRWSQELVKKYEKDWLTMEDIFWWDPVLQNNRTKWRITTFFNKFKSQKLVLDRDTTYYEDKIRLEFDDMRINEKYNKWIHNSDLEFKASEIVKNDYSIDENKFKEKLKTIILHTIEREDFK